MTIKFKCNEIVFIPINQLKEHPKNKLIHPDKEELVDRLCKIIKSKQGFTSPVKIDRNSKVISCGHARLQALKKLGCKEAPCIPIDYENEDYLLADLIADNAANEWREVNKSAVNAILPEIGDIDFDIDVLGIENFEIEPLDKFLDENEQNRKELNKKEKDFLNIAWSDWCSEILETTALLSDLKLFAQSYNKSYLKISFLNALYLNKVISRSATLGYQYHRMLCSGDGKNGSIFNLLEKIKSNNSVSERIRFALAEKPSIEKLVTVSGIAMAGHKAPLDFPVELAKDLYNEFCIDGHALDPCHGWGGRYLGFALSSAKQYTGVDASDLTTKCLTEMHNDLYEYHKKDAFFVNSPFEDIKLDKEKFDFALTSPPYFDRETYIGGDQAHTRYENYDDFINGFYKNMFINTYNALKKTSHFCLQIGNQKYDLDVKAKEIAAQVGFEFIETRSTTMKKLGSTSEDESNEMLIIFRKY